jgi:hypothetical protein
MPTVTCSCENCGKIFYSKDELYVPFVKNGYKFSRPEKTLKTWEDWILHIATHCEECRIKAVPESCETDYLKYRKLI